MDWKTPFKELRERFNEVAATNPDVRHAVVWQGGFEEPGDSRGFAKKWIAHQRIQPRIRDAGSTVGNVSSGAENSMLEGMLSGRKYGASVCDSSKVIE